RPGRRGRRRCGARARALLRRDQAGQHARGDRRTRRPLRSRDRGGGRNLTMSSRKFVSSGSPWEALAGYSRAVVDGRWVFVSGTVGYDLRTNTWPPTAAAQAETSLDTIERALREAGARVLDVVRVRVYVPDRGDVEAVSGVIKNRLGAARAANT